MEPISKNKLTIQIIMLPLIIFQKLKIIYFCHVQPQMTSKTYECIHLVFDMLKCDITRFRAMCVCISFSPYFFKALNDDLVHSLILHYLTSQIIFAT
jgi:hypothetical protein